MIFWDALLELKTMLESEEELPHLIQIRLKDNLITFNNSDDQHDIIIKIDHACKNPFRKGFFELQLKEGLNIEPETLRLFKLYFPYTCLKQLSMQRGKCFAISHFAQTLDGKIASVTGDSKWIGNEENLIHAHRMRALCDGILVGSKTVEVDEPQLNVRKVRGNNPTKVIIGDDARLIKNGATTIDSDTIVFKDNDLQNEICECVEVKKEEGYDVERVLEILVEKGIYSVYIEGGAFTTSRFLEQRELDQIQLHFSNKILGSGLNSFHIEGKFEIRSAYTFENTEYYRLGDEMMFVGTVDL